MRRISVGRIISYIVYFGVAVWANCYAFYALAISAAGLGDKLVAFVLVVLFDMFLAWNFTDRHYRVKMAEIMDKIFDARFELAAADAEINAEMRQKGMFSNQEQLIKIVHEHIKIAREHLDNV
jgi:hypothetical protein